MCLRRIPAQVSPRIREYLRAAAPRKKILAIHNESKPQKVWPAERLRTLVEEFSIAIRTLRFLFWTWNFAT